MPLPSFDPASAPMLPAPTRGEDRIQVALVVDTSEAMTDFIDAVKPRLWLIIEEYKRAARPGRAARLEVALYQYGGGAVRQVLPFTHDLDAVAARLVALRLEGAGGDGGAALAQVSREPTWSEGAGDLHVVFLAGRGGLDGAGVHVALARGLRTNLVHAGGDVEPAWSNALERDRGVLLSVEGDTEAVHMPAPQDEELERLRAQQQQEGCFPDAQALSVVPFSELPADTRLLTRSGLELWSEQKNAESDSLNERINLLVVQRQGFLERERARREAAADDGADAILDAALVERVHQQAAQAGFRIE
jgi:hypothetical protein